MKWSNIKLIMQRELRDQIRDRRTMFMIAILPLLLYPLMGMAYLQVAQFVQEHPTKIKVIGVENLPQEPQLFTTEGFHENMDKERTRLVEVEFDASAIESRDAVLEQAKTELNSGAIDAIVFIPNQFSEQLESYRQNYGATEPPSPEILFSSAKDRSRIAYDRLNELMQNWRGLVVDQTLREKQIPQSAALPFRIKNEDLAEESGRRAVIWSKILPFVIIIWALTGAFYPATDLCAGEKERGTLETLLSSPAERNEIVWGKMLTIMIFSIATSLLNLLSMAFTGTFIASRALASVGGAVAVSEIGSPPLSTLWWLVVALIPLSALFSALSLALAAMARSSKEGQYYLMPLMLITMPLAIIPIMPSTELSLGSSLVPISGVMLLLRSLMEGEYMVALRFAFPVIAVTLVCCWFAIRWAVNQFNDESVMFRENERFEVGAWMVHLVRDRADTPGVAAALMCGVMLLVIRFFAELFVPAVEGWGTFLTSTLIIQFGLILLPALLMTTLLTRSAKKTLLLSVPSLSSILMAFMLAFFLHPAASAFAEVLQEVYPISDNAKELLKALSHLIKGAPVWQLLLILAVVPAICEELAYRGFILSGLRKLGSSGMAIFISSVLFGVMHGFLQQSIAAALLGMLIGYIAIQTQSIVACMIFHMTHNGLQVFSQLVLSADTVARNPRLENFLVPSINVDTYTYSRTIVVLSVLTTLLVLYWFRRLPFHPSAEERLHSALDHQSIHVTAH